MPRGPGGGGRPRRLGPPGRGGPLAPRGPGGARGGGREGRGEDRLGGDMNWEVEKEG